MDDKPQRYPRSSKHRPSHAQQNDRDEQRMEHTGDEYFKKRMRTAVNLSTTCAPEQLHCRYANKKCLNPRAVKRSGGLHTFCDMHRANANRNQRRLDMRKRMARQASIAQNEQGRAPSILDATQQTASTSGVVVPTLSPGDQYSDPRFEPLHSPMPLQEEDISTLITLFPPPDKEGLDTKPRPKPPP